MPRQSKAEREFCERFPYANTRHRQGGITGVAVYAGDYLCAEGLTRAAAFDDALKQVEAGNITPDPTEKPGDFPEAN